jgi:hypothetical protein
MYARPRGSPKPRKAQVRSFPAPVGGWISNRALAEPNAGGPPGAMVLDNFFPRSGGVKLRRGKQRYATLEDETLPVTAVFSYRNGQNQRLFAANANTIYDITVIIQADNGDIIDDLGNLIETENGDWFEISSTFGLDIWRGTTGGDWSVVQFTTTGGVYLVGVNGRDPGFLFDGTDFWPLVAGGVSRLSVGTVSGTFAAGDTVTGGTSTAHGTVLRTEPDGAGLFVFLTDVTGTFVNPETVTSSSGGTGHNTAAVYPAAPGPAFPGDIMPRDSSDMAFVFSYKNRLFFTQNDSLQFWYMPVDAVGGDATLFSLGGVLDRGGNLVFGQTWSMPSTAQGGLSSQCVFVSSEGQIAIYQGDNPDEPTSWAVVGVYRIGTPLGKHAFFQGGGDLAIATTVGLVPLSKAIALDVTALGVGTISYNIADAWEDAKGQRGIQNWVCDLWPEQKMALVAPPNMIGANNPAVFVVNTETGAWARFTGWQVNAMDVFQGQLYFGSDDGQVFAANVSGLDDGAPYSGTAMALFDDMQSPASLKIGQVVRPVSKANALVNQQCSLNYNYNMTTLPAPNPLPVDSGSAWGTAIWSQATWGQMTPSVVNEGWQSGSGLGYTLAPCYQVTSGSVEPLDDQLIRVDVTWSTSEVVT